MKKYLNQLTDISMQLCGMAGAGMEYVKRISAEQASESAKWLRSAAERVATAAKKPPKVKNVLLQTYFTSLICLVLCVGMFLGTSYAWFTSEVNNTGNEIYIGILEAELEKQNKNDNSWLSLSEANDQGVNTNKLFDGAIRWEPGYTALETIRVTNKGDLAFKYVLSFADGTIEAKENTLPLEDVAMYFDVWVYDHAQETAYTKPTSYAAITAADSGWENAGTLDEILAGKNVLDGSLLASDAAAVAEGTASKEHTYTIALHMNEAANASVMGHKISLNVKLVAYQAAAEQDAFGNDGYDNADLVLTLEQLQAALDAAAGDTTIVLGADLTGDVTVTQKPDVKITIDGNGRIFNGVITVDGQSKCYETAALTVRNVNFSGRTKIDDADSSYIRLGLSGNTGTRYTSNVTVEGCTFSGTDMVAVKSFTGGDKNLTISGCTINNGMHSVVQIPGVDGVLIKDCMIYSKNGINVNQSDNVTISGCTADVRGYAVRFGASDGNIGDAETYLISNCVLKSACEDGDAVIILRGTAESATLTIENTTLEGTAKITNNAGATVKQ